MRLPSVPNRGVIAYAQGRKDLVARRILGSPPGVGIPLSGIRVVFGARRGNGPDRRDRVLTGALLRNEPTPEADRYGVGSAARLELREQVPDVGLDGLLRQEETLADLAVHEPVGDEL